MRTSRLVLLSVLLAVLIVDGAHARKKGGKVGGFPSLTPVSLAAIATAAGDGASQTAPRMRSRSQPQAPPLLKGPQVQTHTLEGVEYVLIDARSKPGQAAALVEQLEVLGLAKGVAVAGDVVSFKLPLSRVAELNSLSTLSFATRSLAVTHIGKVQSQGDKAMRSDVLKVDVAGLTGAGVKVGVLSDSYDALRGAASDVASKDLPPNVKVLKDMPSGDDEGRGMLQIVHDVAPSAALYFYTAFDGLADFANGIIMLAKAGCKVIVDDVLYFAEPFFEDGIVAEAVDQVKSQGVAYFSSAGNQGRQSWETVKWREDSDGYYLFEAKVNLQQFYVPPGSVVTLVMQWDQPFGRSASDLDLEVYLYDSKADEFYLYTADNADNTNGDPVAIVSIENSDTRQGGYVYIAIHHSSGPKPGRVKYAWFGSGSPTEHLTDSPALFGHSQAEGAFSCAAAYYPQTPAFGTSPAVLETFSSIGGTPTIFSSSGVRLAKAVVRLKPDGCGPDGVDTTFFGGQDRDGNGKPDFSGTSASAPHIGALAALLRQANPALTPDQAYDILRLTADDMNPYTSRFNFGAGYGLVNALSAYTAAKCRTACGTTTVTWPFHLDAGCGPSGYLLGCKSGALTLTTPSGTYPVASPLRTGYLLLASAVTTQLTAYGCPKGDTAKSFSAVNTPYTISARNVVLGYGTNGSASFTTYVATGARVASRSCTTSTNGVSSYCNGTQCCTMPLTKDSARISFSGTGNCGGADILYPPAVVTSRVSPANAKNNYFLRVDFSAPVRPRSTQACEATIWASAAYRCRWPLSLQPSTRLRDAFGRTAADQAVIDSRYPTSTTLQQALMPGAEQAYSKLGVKAVVALLNSYRVRYPLYHNEVQQQFIDALQSLEQAVEQTNTFLKYNANQWCPLTTC